MHDYCNKKNHIRIDLDLENDADLDTFLTIAAQCDEKFFQEFGLNKLLTSDKLNFK